MTKILPASAAYARATEARVPLHQKALRECVDMIARDVKRWTAGGKTDVCINPGGGLSDLDREAIEHFKAWGYWVRHENGYHQGGGLCKYYYLCWGPRPEPAAVRAQSWFCRVFGG